MSIIFSKRKTVKTISLHILLSASFLYSLQSSAALKTDSDKTPAPSIFNGSISPSYSSPESDIFFDTETYTADLEKQEVIKGLLKSGITLFRKGEKAKGINDLKKAWTLAPNMASTGVTLAMHYIKNSQYTLAIEVAKKQKSTFPTKPYASNIEGFAYQGLKDNKKSVAAFTQALKINPGNSTASLALAEFAIKDNNLKQAKKLYIDVLNHNPINMPTLLLLSKLNLAQGNNSETEKQINKAIKVAPDTALFHNGFAKIYQLIQDYPKALIEINKALKIEPDNAANQFLLAKLLISNNQLDDSRVLLKKLAKSYPYKAEPRELEGRIALAQNKPQEAIKLLQAALNIKKTTSATMHLATAQILSGEIELGLTSLRQQVKKEPENILLRKLFAEHLRKQNQTNEAIQQYKEIISHQPNNILVLNNLSWLLAQQGNIEPALEYIQKAHDAMPLNPLIMDTYSLILMKKERYIQAKELLNKAMMSAPNNLSIQFHLSQVLLKLNKDKAAKNLLNKLLNLKKPFAEQQEAEQLLKSLIPQ